MTDNLNLENETWTIAVVAERGLGGGVNTPVVMTFNFAMKNVCRDLPWKDIELDRQEITYNAYDDQEISIARLGLDQDFPVEWATEYCEISYKIRYKSGPLTDNSLFRRDLTIPMFEFDSAVNAFKGTIKDRQWIGTHAITV
jgi:hypothetical protein